MTISTAYEDLSYSLWLAEGYNTMVTFHAIVHGFYVLVFSKESTDYWKGGIVGYTAHSL